MARRQRPHRVPLGWLVLAGTVLFPEKRSEIAQAAGWQVHDWSEGDNEEAPQDSPTGPEANDDGASVNPPEPVRS